MALLPTPPEAFEQAQEDLRRELRPPVTEVRNVATATEPDAVAYFDYRGTRYRVEPLSYKVGIQLQEIRFEVDRLAQIEEHDSEKMSQEDKERHLEQLLLCYEKAIQLFWKACEPVAFWKRRRHKKHNPFLECTSIELGELLGFFSLCRTKSRVHMLGGLGTRPSLSMSMQRTT